MNGACPVTTRFTIHDLPFCHFFSPPTFSLVLSFRRSLRLSVRASLRLSTRQRSLQLALTNRVQRTTRRERGGAKRLLPKRITRAKIKFFPARLFSLHRPRDRSLLLFDVVYAFLPSVATRSVLLAAVSDNSGRTIAQRNSNERSDCLVSRCCGTRTLPPANFQPIGQS